MQGVTHVCQEQEISFLAMEIMETIRGFHKVEKKEFRGLVLILLIIKASENRWW